MKESESQLKSVEEVSAEFRSSGQVEDAANKRSRRE